MRGTYGTHPLGPHQHALSFLLDAESSAPVPSKSYAGKIKNLAVIARFLGFHRGSPERRYEIMMTRNHPEPV